MGAFCLRASLVCGVPPVERSGVRPLFIYPNYHSQTASEFSKKRGGARQNPYHRGVIVSTKHVLYWDSVRGLACMAVVLLHLVITMYPELTCHGEIHADTPAYMYWFNYPPFNLLIAGRLAVWLFFILSGFVLSYRFMGETNMKWKIIEAIAKRPIRLLGIVYFTLLPILGFLWTSEFWCTRLFIDYDIYLRCAYRIIFSPFAAGEVSNPPLWTIAIELWGSFLVFGLCLLIGNWHKTVRLAILLSLIVWFRDTFYVAFMLGMLFADLHKNWQVASFIKFKTVISYVILVPAVLCGTYQGILTPTPASINADVINSITLNGYPMISAILIFVFVMCNDRAKQILETKILIFIGGISYGVYIIHWSVIGWCQAHLRAAVLTQCHGNAYLASVVFMVIVLVLVLACAYLADRVVDRPCIKFSAWFAKKLIGEIQSRINVVCNMTTPIFRNVKGLITRVLYKYRYSQDSLILIPAINDDDKLVPVSEHSGTAEEDNKHD